MEDQEKYFMKVPGTYVLLTGKTLEPVKPSPIVVLDGSISAPAEWIGQKYIYGHRDCVCKGAFVVINAKNGTIVFREDGENPLAPIITGKLQANPEIDEMQINTGTKMSAFELANVIKMNRSMMPDLMAAMELVSKLNNFKANVEKAIEQFKDDRANFSHRQSQIASTNLPASFVIEIEPFLDVPKAAFVVEIVIHNDLSLSLVSPELNDYIKQYKKIALAEQAARIRELIVVPIFYTY